MAWKGAEKLGNIDGLLWVCCSCSKLSGTSNRCEKKTSSSEVNSLNEIFFLPPPTTPHHSPPRRCVCETELELRVFLRQDWLTANWPATCAPSCRTGGGPPPVHMLLRRVPLGCSTARTDGPSQAPAAASTASASAACAGRRRTRPSRNAGWCRTSAASAGPARTHPTLRRQCAPLSRSHGQLSWR